MVNRVLLRCQKCGRYTMEAACPACGQATGSPHPPRYSPENRYGVYRRKLKYPEAYGLAPSSMPAEDPKKRHDDG